MIIHFILNDLFFICKLNPAEQCGIDFSSNNLPHMAEDDDGDGDDDQRSSLDYESRTLLNYCHCQQRLLDIYTQLVQCNADISQQQKQCRETDEVRGVVKINNEIRRTDSYTYMIQGCFVNLYRTYALFLAWVLKSFLYWIHNYVNVRHLRIHPYLKFGSPRMFNPCLWGNT